jgi:hypothetical protein
LRPELPLDPAADVEDGDQDEVATREVTSEEDRATGARVTGSPQWQGAAVVEACSEPLVDGAGNQYTPSLDELALDLKAKFAKVREGDLSDPEAMLLAQACALQAIFSTLALKALTLTGLASMQTCMSVALKAQAQSRATLIALADMKQSRQPSFIGQQNIAVNQQVNNSAMSSLDVAETKNPPIKLLEAPDGEGLDSGTQSATSGVDPYLETVAKVHGAQDGGG